MTHSATADSSYRPAKRSRFKFIFKIICAGSMLGFFAISRTNPELHQAMLFKATEIVGTVMGNENGEAQSTTMAQRFQDKIKVNRFGNGGGNAFSSGGGSAASNTQAQADELGNFLANMKVGG